MPFEIIDWKDRFNRDYKVVVGDEKKEKEDVILRMIMLTYNSEDYLEKCLEATKNQTGCVFALDNGSTDRTLNILKDYNVNYITSKKKGDLSWLMNKNLKQVPVGGWCLYVNPDEILFDLPRGFIGKYCSFLERNDIFASDVRFPDFIYNYATLFAGFDWGEGPGKYWTARRLFRFTGSESFRGDTHFNISNYHPKQRCAPIPNHEHTGMWGGCVTKTELIKLFHYGKCRGIERQRGKGKRLVHGDSIAFNQVATIPYTGRHPSVMYNG